MEFHKIIFFFNSPHISSKIDKITKVSMLRVILKLIKDSK